MFPTRGMLNTSDASTPRSDARLVGELRLTSSEDSSVQWEHSPTGSPPIGDTSLSNRILRLRGHAIVI